MLSRSLAVLGRAVSSPFAPTSVRSPLSLALKRRLRRSQWIESPYVSRAKHCCWSYDAFLSDQFADLSKIRSTLPWKRLPNGSLFH